VFDNRVLRRIFGPKRREVTGWRILHNEDLHNLYSSPCIIRKIKRRIMRRTWHVARTGQKRNGFGILVGTPEGKSPLGRPRCKRVDNIVTYLLHAKPVEPQKDSSLSNTCTQQ
jgi:hypothetical protein